VLVWCSTRQRSWSIAVRVVHFSSRQRLFCTSPTSPPVRRPHSVLHGGPSCRQLATDLRRLLHWLPVKQWIDYKIAVVTFKAQSTGVSAYLASLVHTCDSTLFKLMLNSNSCIHQLLLSVKNDIIKLRPWGFTLPNCTYKLYKFSFVNPCLFNYK